MNCYSYICEGTCIIANIYTLISNSPNYKSRLLYFFASDVCKISSVTLCNRLIRKTTLIKTSSPLLEKVVVNLSLGANYSCYRLFRHILFYYEYDTSYQGNIEISVLMLIIIHFVIWTILKLFGFQIILRQYHTKLVVQHFSSI